MVISVVGITLGMVLMIYVILCLPAMFLLGILRWVTIYVDRDRPTQRLAQCINHIMESIDGPTKEETIKKALYCVWRHRQEQ